MQWAYVRAVSKKRAVQAAVITGVAFSLAGCFGNGNHSVGVKGLDVRPGLYTSAIPLGGHCAAEREQAGTAGFVGVAGSSGGRSFIDVLTTDTGVMSSGCGIWIHPRIVSYNPNRATAKVGTYRVPTDLLPGSYAAPGGAGCSWQRLSDFKGTAGSVITQSVNPGLAPRVTIASTDAGFKTTVQCGGWHRVAS
jgi:hypothetical protein